MSRELLDMPGLQIEGVYALEEWIAGLPEQSRYPRHQIVPVSPAELRQISMLTTPNQVLAVVRTPHPAFDPQWLQDHWSLYLDGIRDPGNLGTILRIADWFGLSWICGAPGGVEVFHPKVVQASMGAVLRVSYAELTTDQLQHRVGDWPIIGATMAGADLFEARLPQRGLIVIGNESQGISVEVAKLLTGEISIPRGRTGGAESLNAAVAAGIISAWMSAGPKAG